MTHGITRAALACLGTAWLVSGALPQPAEAQATSARRTTWDGVFTTAQAGRGEAAYRQSCAACHAEDLRGSGTAPSLVEESFAFLFGDLTVGELFTKTRTTMPSDKPGSLVPQTYADIVAFLLQKNGYPAGTAALPVEPTALDAIVVSTSRPPGR